MTEKVLGYDKPLYMLAFDHRDIFKERLFGIEEVPAAKRQAYVSDAKRVIFEGLERAVADGAPRASAGLLVDEEFGSEIARQARADGYPFAVPVERSGQAEFDFEYGEAYGEHIESIDPTFAKVLVRHNPAGDQGVNRRQAERLGELSDWLHSRDRKLLFELLVPAEPAQLETVGGDPARFRQEIKPDLIAAAMGELQEAGVEPDVWKIEGLDRREDCIRAAEQARTGGRSRVVCIVLGAGAGSELVERWLRQGAGVPGYAGFAVGRTLWWAGVNEWLAGRLTREAAAQAIAQNFGRLIETYVTAAQAR